MNAKSYTKLLPCTRQLHFIAKRYNGLSAELALGPSRRYATGENAHPKEKSKRRPKQISTATNEHTRRAFSSSHNAGAASNTRRKEERSRVNIVSSDLCDDVLGRLGPSLKQHKNCDILEVNPGPGLWSSKIHEHLKPRSHILMEPNERAYRPSIKKLLNKPGSRYKHVPWSGTEWASYQRLMDEGYLPQQTVLGHGDPLQDRPNKSLLFLANFAHFPPKSLMGFSSVTFQMFYQLMSAIRTHSLFQQYGLVRMLIWIADEEKSYILPRTVAIRRKTSVDVEHSCEGVIEIAGGDGSGGPFRREKITELQSAVRTSERMSSAGVHTPNSRKTQLQLEAEAIMASDGSSSSAADSTNLTTTYDFDTELEALEKRWKKVALPQNVPDVGPRRKKARSKTSTPTEQRGASENVDYRRLLELRTKRRAYDRTALTLEEIISLSNTISSLEGEPSQHTKSSDDTSTSSADSRLADLRSTRRALFSKLNFDNRIKLQHYSDDRDAFNATPNPLLFWDRRPYHPLLTHPEDFSNRQHGMCLLDVHPAATSPAIRAKPRAYNTFELITKQLFAHRRRSFVKEIEALAPGAVEALVPQVPALADRLRQDGWTEKAVEDDDQPGDEVEDVDYESERPSGEDEDDVVNDPRTVNQLRVRMLTPEILEGLAIAWDNWLFKPTPTDLYMKVDAKYDTTVYRPGAGGLSN